MDALHQTSTTSFVYTSYDTETGEYGGLKEVEAGISNSDYVEILSGLEEGDTVWYVEKEDNPFAAFGFPGGEMPSGGFNGGERPSGGGMPSGSSSPNPDFDCGLAVQNMYLAAASLGYGTKIISAPTMALNGSDHDQICEKLGVDPSLTAVAVLLIGKPDTSVDGVSGASVRAGLEDKTLIIG